MYPLYDKNSRCCKCWLGMATTRVGVELMVRTCGNCGHVWKERPMDQATSDELVRLASHGKNPPGEG